MRRRKAFALFDAVLAAALLAVLLAVSVATLRAMSAGRRATENRAIALELAANAIERAVRLPWNELRPEALDEIARKARVAEALPGATMNLTAESVQGEADVTRLVAEVRMPSAAGQSSPVRLGYWVHRDGGTSR